MFSFKIYTEKYQSKATLLFVLNDKEYLYNVTIYTPDCEQYMDDINAHYMCYEKINEYGAKQKYIEYVTCFENLANNINNNEKLKLFDLDINKELSNNIIEKTQDLFLKLNKDILHKTSIWFRLDN